MRKLRTFMVWGLISVLMQVGFLYYVERQIDAGSVSAAPQPPVIVQTTLELPQADVKNLQASYHKDYLAYTDSQGLKVVDVKTSKVVFKENKPVKGQILDYHWLPDRNILLFFVAKPNPKPKPKPVVEVQPKTEVLNKEDPQAKPQPAPSRPKPAPYYNPQVTELYSVDFGFSLDAGSGPDSRLESVLSGFPAGGVIQAVDFSTFTNLIYLTVKTSYGQILYEIDVMRNISQLQRSGEKIVRISTSDKRGTLYVQSVLYGVPQIIAVKHAVRQQLLRGSQYILLGEADNKVMVGVLEGDSLVKVLSIPDTGLKDKTSDKTSLEWQGNIPWKEYNVISGSGDFLVFYGNDGAVVLDKGKQRTVTFSGKENYLTADGREVMELTPNADGTAKVLFKPL